MTDRTDNARAEAWEQGFNAGYEDQQYRDTGKPMPENPYLAAGRAETTTADCPECGDNYCRCGIDWTADPRAETTTATDEDAEQAVVDALGQSPFAHHEVIPSGETASTLYITHDDEWSELASLIVQMLASRGLLATARTHPTRDDIEGVVAGVLFNAMNHPDPVAVLGKSTTLLRVKITDAVMRAIARTEADQ